MKRKIISVFTSLLLLLNTVSVLAYSATEALDLLSFSKISFEDESAVTMDLFLVPDFQGHNITWTSTNESVISTTGKVKRPAVGADPVRVDVIATIGEQSRVFHLTVLPYTSDSEVLTLSKNTLSFTDLTSESIDNVTSTLTLPSFDEYGTVIQWKSSNNAILKIVPDGDSFKGEISKASFSDGVYSVLLTATLIYGNSFDEKQFYIRVNEDSMIYTYSNKMSAIVDAFDREFKATNNINAVRTNLNLPSVSDVEVSYESSKPEIIMADGTVIRPVESDENVLFTVTLRNGYENTHIIYSLTVKPISEDETVQRLEEDLEWAVNSISSSGSLAALTENLQFVNRAPNGSNVSYSSSDTSILGNDGKITRGDVDKTVTLNIRVYFADEYRDETITITVKALPVTGGGTPAGIGGNTAPAGPSTGGAVNPVPSVTPTSPYTYSDVLPSHWAYSAIEDLTKRGIVNGNDDGTFGPNDSITREAFVKMLVMAMELHIDWYETPFTDVTDGAWYYNYVATAVNAGLVNGIEDNLFGVGYNITRQDICVLIYRAFYAGQTAEDASCNDFSTVSDYAKEAVSVMYKKGILQGDNEGNFNPKKSASRAEVTAIFSRLLNNQ